MGADQPSSARRTRRAPAYVAATALQARRLPALPLQDDRLRHDLDDDRQRHPRRRLHPRRPRGPGAPGCSTPAPRAALYVSFDDGAHWQPLQATCRSPIHDLEGRRSGRSHGAGWILRPTVVKEQRRRGRRAGPLVLDPPGGPADVRRRRMLRSFMPSPATARSGRPTASAAARTRPTARHLLLAEGGAQGQEEVTLEIRDGRDELVRKIIEQGSGRGVAARRGDDDGAARRPRSAQAPGQGRHEPLRLEPAVPGGHALRRS